jgi:hypothetical protein
MLKSVATAQTATEEILLRSRIGKRAELGQCE